LPRSRRRAQARRGQGAAASLLPAPSLLGVAAEHAQGRGDGLPSRERSGDEPRAAHPAAPRCRRHPRTPRPTGDGGAAERARGARAPCRVRMARQRRKRSRQRREHLVRGQG